MLGANEERFGEFGIDGEPLVSLKREGGNASAETLTVQFKIEIIPKGKSLILCWVDYDGVLRHFYNISKFHEERTYLVRQGHAFVLYIEKSSMARPHTVWELTDILCSFRSSKCPQTGFIQQVQVFSEVQLGKALSKNILRVIPEPPREYRIIVEYPTRNYSLPSYDSDWVIEYVFACPVIPGEGSFDEKTNTFYVWGDLSFDAYGLSSIESEKNRKSLHKYNMNQIVPQVMIGKCLAANDKNFMPKYLCFNSWVIQAQYFWNKGDVLNSLSSRALCGKIVHVQPRETITSRIEYSAATGSLQVSIKGSNSENISYICIERPFPEEPSLFKSWKDFFFKCEQVEKKYSGHQVVKGRPCLNIEYKGICDLGLLKSICPFRILRIDYPDPKCPTLRNWRTFLYEPGRGFVQKLENTETVLHVNDAAILGKHQSKNVSLCNSCANQATEIE